MDILHNPKCFANHIGLYAMDVAYLTKMVGYIKAGLWSPSAGHGVIKRESAQYQKRISTPDGVILGAVDVPEADKKAEEDDNDYSSTVGYGMYNGVCLLDMNGPSMKGRSKFGGYSSIDARRQLMRARRDPKCNSILMVMDSPGGACSGTEELANTVAEVNNTKPVHAHFDDMGASAAYWVASQARKITANATALVGSIGTLAVVEDSSKAAEMAGIEVHVISTGPLKGAGAPGTKVTQNVLDHYQAMVDDTNAFFLSAVSKGRGMKKADVEAAATGEVYMAKDALKLGLLDELCMLKSAADAMVSKYTPKPPKKSMRNIDASIRLAGME